MKKKIYFHENKSGIRVNSEIEEDQVVEYNPTLSPSFGILLFVSFP